MRSMEAFEYRYLIQKELSSLIGKRLDRVRKTKGYKLKFGSHEIIIVPGKRMHETWLIEENDKDNLCEKIEKEFKGKVLREIKMINDDRIIEFRYDNGSIIFEQFGKGNVVLIINNEIEFALRYESWSTREIKRGKEYVPPPAPDKELICTDKYIIVSLMKMPIGKKYVKEALRRAQIEEQKPGNQLNEEDKKRILEELKRLEVEAKPYLIKKNSEIIDFSLFYGEGAETTNSLSEAADKYYAEGKEINPKLIKLEKRLEYQKEQLEKLKAQAEEYENIANKIYENYDKVSAALEEAKRNKKWDKNRQIEIDI